MLRTSSTVLFIGLFASACSQPAVRQPRTPQVSGTVIGSIVVELERKPRSAWDGFFEEDLAVRKPDYVFHFASAERNWGIPTERVKVRLGEPRPFVIGLRPGRASLEDLELALYSGPARWLFGAISPTDGKRFPIDLEFSVDPRQITYIGRIRVVLPRKLQLFSSRAQVVVEDATAEDHVSMGTLIELSKLPVTTALAHRQGER